MNRVYCECCLFTALLFEELGEMISKDFLSVKEVAAQIRTDVNATYRLLNAGEIQAYRGSKRWLILQTAVDDYLERHSNRPPPVVKEEPAVE